MAIAISISWGLPMKTDRDRAFSSWLSMMRRCFIESDGAFQNYGARGISVAARWYDWRNFLADMGERPAGTTLDRIDVHGDYTPGNCRWADAVTQARNTTRNVQVELAGQTMLACDAAKRLGVTPSCITRRVRGGGPIGERRPLKLTAAQVSDIKRRLRTGDTLVAISRDFNVTRQHVAGIRDGRVWQRV